LHNLTLKVEGIFGMLHIPLSFPLGSREPPKTSLSHTHTHTPLIPSIFSFLLPLSFPHALISLSLSFAQPSDNRRESETLSLRRREEEKKKKKPVDG